MDMQTIYERLMNQNAMEVINKIISTCSYIYSHMYINLQKNEVGHVVRVLFSDADEIIQKRMHENNMF